MKKIIDSAYERAIGLFNADTNAEGVYRIFSCLKCRQV